MKIIVYSMTALIVLAASASVVRGDSTQVNATEIMKRSHLAYYYAADDGNSSVIMRLINRKGRERVREFSMLRIDIEEGGDQKYFTYFRKPSDVARLTFMVHKSVDGNDKRWIYVPAVDLIKPISADDKNSSFVGSDFTYEDVSGRHWTEDNHRLVRDSLLDDKPVFVIESIPKRTYKGFARKVSYIDTLTYIPLREEYYDKKNKLARIFRADKVELIGGFPTVTTRSMENVKKGSRTVLVFSSIAYNVGLKESLFTERYLKSPPRKYIK